LFRMTKRQYTKDVVCAFDDLVCLFVLEAMIRRHVVRIRTFLVL
jgi:hypothetical protein